MFQFFGSVIGDTVADSWSGMVDAFKPSAQFSRMFVFSLVSFTDADADTAAIASSGFTIQALSKSAVADFRNVTVSYVASAIQMNSSEIVAAPIPKPPGVEPSHTNRFSLSLVGGQALPGQWNTAVLIPFSARMFHTGSALQLRESKFPTILSMPEP